MVGYFLLRFLIGYSGIFRLKMPSGEAFYQWYFFLHFPCDPSMMHLSHNLGVLLLWYSYQVTLFFQKHHYYNLSTSIYLSECCYRFLPTLSYYYCQFLCFFLLFCEPYYRRKELDTLILYPRIIRCQASTFIVTNKI